MAAKKFYNIGPRECGQTADIFHRQLVQVVYVYFHPIFTYLVTFFT
jgi:hypothetical protein